LYPNGVDPGVISDLPYRRVLCQYLCSSLCIEIARLEGNLEQQLNYYKIARNHIAMFRKSFGRVAKRPEREVIDAKQRLATLVVYDFEAATRLKDWEVLIDLVEEGITMETECENVIERFSDLIIGCNAPEKTVTQVLQHIVNYMISSQARDTTKLARWIRFLVQYSLVRDLKTAEGLLVQAIELARDAQADGTYPDEEIQWLAGQDNIPFLWKWLLTESSNNME
jgi:hypothetical protein